MITESDLNSRLKHLLENFGVSTRIESAITSGLPDIMYASGGTLVLIESKIERSGRVSIPLYQYAWAKRTSHHLAPHYHWLFALTEDGERLKAYTFAQLFEFCKPDLNGKTLKCETRSITPLFDHIRSKENIKAWLDYIEEQEFSYQYNYGDS